MKKYVKDIIDNKCKLVYNGDNINYALEKGYIEMDVEQAYDNQWYVVGYAPEQPKPSKEEILVEKRALRNQYLQDSDKYMLADFPISSSERNKWKEYRVYLRDFFNDEEIAVITKLKTFEEYFS